MAQVVVLAQDDLAVAADRGVAKAVSVAAPFKHRDRHPQAADLVSARILIQLDQDLPVLGGKTLRVKAGVTFAYRDGRPLVVLRGISVMGVPMPSAWLGGMKNVDLVQEFGGDTGFWKAFSDGVEDIRVEEGQLTVRLKE